MGPGVRQRSNFFRSWSTTLAFTATGKIITIHAIASSPRYWAAVAAYRSCSACSALRLGAGFSCRLKGSVFPAILWHFSATPTGAWVLDPFNGIIVEEQAVEEHLSGLMGKPIRLPSSAWEPVSTQMLTMRILHNLRNAFLVQKNLAMVVRMLDFLIAVEPSAAQHWRERALLHYREGRWEETQHDLRSYFLRAGFIPHLSSPFAPGGQNQPSPGPLTPEDAKLVELYQESNVMLTRIN